MVAANTLGLEKDPDRLMEDGQAAIGKNCRQQVESKENLLISLPIYMFDIYQYLLQFSDHETLQNYEKLEGFTKYKDGHVLDVQTVTRLSLIQEDHFQPAYFKRNKNNLPVKERLLFYNCYILPHLNYCCAVWGNCPTNQQSRIT